MPFQDSDPERRNLMITSLGFILFFLAGGKLNEDSLKLPMLNIEFCRPEVIAVFTWIALFWFVYRYWLKHSFEFVDSFSRELSDKKYIAKAMKDAPNIDTLPIVPDREKGLHIDRLYWKWNGMYAYCKYATSVDRNSNYRISNITSHVRSKDVECKFGTILGWKTALAITGDCMFSQPSFSDYFVPYILFATAVISGIVSLVF